MNEKIHHDYHKAIFSGYKFDNQMNKDKDTFYIRLIGRVGLPRWDPAYKFCLLPT